jgi:hypothetical protein
MEHKQQGIKALELLKSKSLSNVPDKETTEQPEVMSKNSSCAVSRTGLDCLDELCTISQNLEKDFQMQSDHKTWMKSKKPDASEKVKQQNDDDSKMVNDRLSDTLTRKVVSLASSSKLLPAEKVLEKDQGNEKGEEVCCFNSEERDKDNNEVGIRTQSPEKSEKQLTTTELRLDVRA